MVAADEIRDIVRTGGPNEVVGAVAQRSGAAGNLLEVATTQTSITNAAQLVANAEGAPLIARNLLDEISGSADEVSDALELLGSERWPQMRSFFSESGDRYDEFVAGYRNAKAGVTGTENELQAWYTGVIKNPRGAGADPNDLDEIQPWDFGERIDDGYYLNTNFKWANVNSASPTHTAADVAQAKDELIALRVASANNEFISVDDVLEVGDRLTLTSNQVGSFGEAWARFVLRTRYGAEAVILEQVEVIVTFTNGRTFTIKPDFLVQIKNQDGFLEFRYVEAKATNQNLIPGVEELSDGQAVYLAERAKGNVASLEFRGKAFDDAYSEDILGATISEFELQALTLIDP